MHRKIGESVWYWILTGFISPNLRISMSPANIYMFKISNTNTKKRCRICSKLTIKTQERPLHKKWSFPLRISWLNPQIPDFNGGVLVAYFIPFCNAFIVGFWTGKCLLGKIISDFIYNQQSRASKINNIDG